MESGDIFRHVAFYADPETGELRSKYLLFLAPIRGGDWVVRLLTSRENGRPRRPRCFHGDPYPGFFLGVPGPPLEKETWVDLRGFRDVDEVNARAVVAKHILHRAGKVSGTSLREALECVAGAVDTTRIQEQAIRDQMPLVASGC